MTTATMSVSAWVGSAKKRVRRSDRKSTRLNSSHRTISYAVFCLKKKKKKKKKKIKKKNKISKKKTTYNSTTDMRISKNTSNNLEICTYVMSQIGSNTCRVSISVN